jgi:hypothetical protein
VYKVVSSGQVTMTATQSVLLNGLSSVLARMHATASATVGTGTPANRERHALEWDPVNSKVVVFGGYTGSFPNFSDTDDLWVYAPGTNAWAQVPKAGTWPTARKDASMVWAADLGAFLVFGGNNGANANNRFAELWKLSISATTAATWTALTPAGGATPALSAACVVYATNLHRMILFSGNPTDTTLSTQTYQYLSDTNTWQLDTPSGTIPPGRSFVACAWDPVNERMIVYGGQDAPGNPIDGIFTYEPVTQTWATPQMAVVPGPRSDVGATYSPTLGAMVGYGGRTASTTYTNGTFTLSLTPL